MEESYVPALLIIALFILAGMAAWLGEEFRKWRLRRMKSQKPLDHIDVRR
jgi:hypothetical protein